MFFITGDLHGDISRIEAFCERRTTTLDDVMIVLGDAGINYYGDYRDEALKERLAALSLTLFCIHGNHEQRPGNIPSYLTMTWKGGTVYYEKQHPNILFAQDGEVFDFDGNSVLVIGGAYSVDKHYRLARGWHWFENEQPSAEIKAKVMRVLASRFNYIDCILSHTCPMKYIPTEAFLPFINQDDVNKSTEEWLDKVREIAHYRKWYCGHYHINKQDRKIEFLFETVKNLQI